MISCLRFVGKVATMKVAASLSLLVGVSAHGRISFPPNRNGGTLEVGGTTCGYHDGGTQIEDGCAWLTNAINIPGDVTLIDPLLLTTKASIADPVDKLNPEVTPWRAPGTAPVLSPCGNNLYHPTKDGRDLPPNPTHTTWRAGSAVEVATTVYINHGGGWSWRLCPKSAPLTEECFQQTYLRFVGDSSVIRYTDGSTEHIPAHHTADGFWSRNEIPSEDLNSGEGGLEFPCPLRHGQCGQKWKYSVVEQVEIPADIQPGEYALSWRWDCQKSQQVWLNCADVTIAAPEIVA